MMGEIRPTSVINIKQEWGHTVKVEEGNSNWMQCDFLKYIKTSY